MAHPRNIENYPWAQFNALFVHVSTTRKPITVPCVGGRPKALSIRGQMYAFRRSCQDNEPQAIRLGIDVSTLMDVVITPSDAGVTLTHREESEIAKLIEDTLAAEGAPPIPANPAMENSAAASLAKLMSLITKPDA